MLVYAGLLSCVFFVDLCVRFLSVSYSLSISLFSCFHALDLSRVVLIDLSVLLLCLRYCRFVFLVYGFVVCLCGFVIFIDLLVVLFDLCVVLVAFCCRCLRCLWCRCRCFRCLWCLRCWCRCFRCFWCLRCRCRFAFYDHFCCRCFRYAYSLVCCVGCSPYRRCCHHHCQCHCYHSVSELSLHLSILPFVMQVPFCLSVFSSVST